MATLLIASCLTACNAFEAVRHETRGQRLLAEGNPKAALEEANLSIERVPSWRSYLLRADAYYEMGDYRSAVRDYQKVLEIHFPPDSRAEARARNLASYAAVPGATASPDVAFDLRRVDFSTVRYPLSDPELTHEDVEVKQIAFGDLDGDGGDEAAVLVIWSYARHGGNGYGYICYVYSGKAGEPRLLAQLDGGGKSGDIQMRGVEIKKSKLVVTQCESELRGNQPPADFLATVDYSWNGRQLVSAQKSRIGVANCWNQ